MSDNRTNRRGRYAPSPTGRLHLGNLRTAMIAWLFSRSAGAEFLLRFEDLDRAAVRAEHEASQRADLLAIGVDWDGEPSRQSDRTERYDRIIESFLADDRVYPCFCTRRDIAEATQAPNGPTQARHYPGTCRSLGTAQQRRLAEDRPPALRLRADGSERTVHDELLGSHTFVVDDFVIRRNDGTPAYNLASVVDDADEQIGLVVRADDLLDSTARQIIVFEAIDAPVPSYAHVPLVVNGEGKRLAKRDGAVTLGERDEGPDGVRSLLATSLGLADEGETVSMTDLVARFDPAALPTETWTPPSLTDG